MVKMTFTVDEATAATLRRSAEQLQKPQSAVIREAVALHAAHIDRLSPAEQTRMLRALDVLTDRPATRSAAAVEAELAEIRASRRAAARRRR
jgi:hypothetical protein